eukprot:TRINITY_DN2236_c10_g1_i1.p1 TRINITY_DN2236_c10_g1~~TRINITY_DN2236_c10_g1_i1.p1  ORF type:complete len:471 (-),score=92.13 TRINITY_DN2236_c10_g1_i1:108-1382(-)
MEYRDKSSSRDHMDIENDGPPKHKNKKSPNSGVQPSLKRMKARSLNRSIETDPKPPKEDPWGNPIVPKKNSQPERINKTKNCNVVVRELNPPSDPSETAFKRSQSMTQRHRTIVQQQPPPPPPPIMPPPRRTQSAPSPLQQYQQEIRKPAILVPPPRNRSRSPPSRSPSPTSPRSPVFEEDQESPPFIPEIPIGKEEKEDSIQPSPITSFTCPFCPKHYNEFDLTIHIYKKHPRDRNTVRTACPICTQRGMEIGQMKDLWVHLKSDHHDSSSGHLLQLRDNYRSVPAELLTRTNRNAFLNGLRGHRGEHKDIHDQLWEYVLAVDDSSVTHSRVICDACGNFIEISQTKAILPCQHSFHVECVSSTCALPECALCLREMNVTMETKPDAPSKHQTEEKKKKKKKKKSKKKKTEKSAGSSQAMDIQ